MRLNNKSKNIRFCFVLSSPFTTLPLRGEDRRRLNNKSKNFVICFVLSSPFTIFVSWGEESGKE